MIVGSSELDATTGWRQETVFYVITLHVLQLHGLCLFGGYHDNGSVP